MDNTKNTLDSLSDHMFVMLENLTDDELSKDPEKARLMIQRASAVNEIANNMINLGRLELDYTKFAFNAKKMLDKGESLPCGRLLEIKDK